MTGKSDELTEMILHVRDEVRKTFMRLMEEDKIIVVGILALPLTKELTVEQQWFIYLRVAAVSSLSHCVNRRWQEKLTISHRVQKRTAVISSATLPNSNWF